MTSQQPEPYMGAPQPKLPGLTPPTEPADFAARLAAAPGSTETIKLMRDHASVRSFTDEKFPPEVLREILQAGQHAPTWRNQQSYSILVTQDDRLKEQIFDLVPQPWIKTCAAFLLFAGDLNRAEVAVQMHDGEFQPSGIEPVLVSAVDAALAAENVLLAAESLGYGGVFIGTIRQQSAAIADLFGLSGYSYPITGLCLGRPKKKNPAKQRLPFDEVVHFEQYRLPETQMVRDYDATDLTNAGAVPDSNWSDRLVDQWGKPSSQFSTNLLKERGMI